MRKTLLLKLCKLRRIGNDILGPFSDNFFFGEPVSEIRYFIGSKKVIYT